MKYTKCLTFFTFLLFSQFNILFRQCFLAIMHMTSCQVQWHVILKMTCGELKNLYLLNSSLLKSTCTYSDTSYLKVNPFFLTFACSITTRTSKAKTKPRTSTTKNQSQGLFRSFYSFIFLLSFLLFLSFPFFSFLFFFYYFSERERTT